MKVSIAGVWVVACLIVGLFASVIVAQDRGRGPGAVAPPTEDLSRVLVEKTARLAACHSELGALEQLELQVRTGKLVLVDQALAIARMIVEREIPGKTLDEAGKLIEKKKTDGGG